jgi:hypothetical protein
MQNRLEWFAERLLLLRERSQEPKEIVSPLDAAVNLALFVRQFFAHDTVKRSTQ